MPSLPSGAVLSSYQPSGKKSILFSFRIFQYIYANTPPKYSFLWKVAWDFSLLFRMIMHNSLAICMDSCYAFLNENSTETFLGGHHHV